MCVCVCVCPYSRIHIYVVSFLECNGFRRRKWNRLHKIKSGKNLLAFHIALIPLV